MLTGQFTPCHFPLGQKSDKLVTATIAIISFVVCWYARPGHPLYQYQATSVGKMYSVTMMVVLNNRIVLQAQDEVMVLDEQLTVPPNVYKIHVSLATQVSLF